MSKVDSDLEEVIKSGAYAHVVCSKGRSLSGKLLFFFRGEKCEPVLERII